MFQDHRGGLLFTGDHVLPTITPSIGFELGARELPLQHYLSSLRLLLTRPDARLMPAHGYPTDSVHGRVHELLGHHAERFDQAERVLRSLGAPARPSRSPNDCCGPAGSAASPSSTSSTR